MKSTFMLMYWEDDGGYVGKLKEVSGIFSQGEILAALGANIFDTYKLIVEEDELLPQHIHTKKSYSKTVNLLVLLLQ